MTQTAEVMTGQWNVINSTIINVFGILFELLKNETGTGIIIFKQETII